MAISSTYAEIVLEEIIRELLEEGTAPTVVNLSSLFDTYTVNNDISKALFQASDYTVEKKEISSVTKYNNTLSTIQKDLKVLYRHLLKEASTVNNYFERWRAEAAIVENRLKHLEDRISSLLLITRDTTGYLNYVQDDLIDGEDIDFTNSTTAFDFKKGIVTIGTSNTSATRIDLSSLTAKDLSFVVLTRNNLVATVPSEVSNIKHAISDINTFWQERIHMSDSRPVSAEFKVTFPEVKTISRIDIDLHMSNTNSPVQLTPMYSTDDHNYSQLPITSYTREVYDKTSFRTTPISAKYIKFIMTKAGYDQNVKQRYIYEFGIDELSFYNEGFTADTTTTSGSLFVSDILSVVDNTGTVQQFGKATLEVCEEVPDGTSIDYYLAASNNSLHPCSSAVWAVIDPLTRTNPSQTTVVDFSDLDDVVVSGITISYDSDTTAESFVRPSQAYTVINSISSSTAVTVSGLASDQRYEFLNNEDMILSHVVASGVVIVKDSLEVWRNVNVRGTETKVRDRVNGWGFSDPYYYTTVYVSNAAGKTIDFGSRGIVLDGVARKGSITISYGNHKIEVHKDNWKNISTSSITNLSSLKSADSLYPYNHRYLVEGITYPTAWSTTEEKIYTGFDIMGQYLMKQVSVFDLLENVATNDYQRFALDKELTDTSAKADGVSSSHTGMDCFLVKVDTANSDFINEKFLIKFKSANTLYKYLRLKAVLKTTSTTVAPILDAYRIKLQ